MGETLYETKTFIDNTRASRLDDNYQMGKKC